MKDVKWKDVKKETFFSELSSLLASGLDFSRSFRLLTEGETNKRIKSVLEEIHRSVIGGNALWPVSYTHLRAHET